MGRFAGRGKDARNKADANKRRSVPTQQAAAPRPGTPEFVLSLAESARADLDASLADYLDRLIDHAEYQTRAKDLRGEIARLVQLSRDMYGPLHHLGTRVEVVFVDHLTEAHYDSDGHLTLTLLPDDPPVPGA